ncbi:MAG: exodeoxyribonuclease VII large subunit, partial [uncultured bacterium]
MSNNLANDSKCVLSITDLIAQVNDALEDRFQSVWVRGEISNFKAYPSGHYYFTLKDQNAQISAVMFKGYNKALKFEMENGLSVIAHGKLSVYEAQGRFQIQINHAEPDGLGALQLAFEQLKNKLQQEGLFDPKRKKPLPVLPRRLGVVTSLQGAAIRDIITVAQRRFANLDMVIYPVKV